MSLKGTKIRNSLEIPERARNLKTRLRPNIRYIIGRWKPNFWGMFGVSFEARRFVVAFITNTFLTLFIFLRADYALACLIRFRLLIHSLLRPPRLSQIQIPFVVNNASGSRIKSAELSLIVMPS